VCKQPCRSTQLCIPPGSLNRVPAFLGKGGNVTSARWQVTLCDLILHVSSCNSDGACWLLYSVILLYFLGAPTVSLRVGGWVCLAVCVGAPCGTREDGNLGAGVGHQSGAGQTLPCESQRRPVTKWTARLLSQGDHLVWITDCSSCQHIVLLLHSLSSSVGILSCRNIRLLILVLLLLLHLFNGLFSRTAWVSRYQKG